MRQSGGAAESPTAPPLAEGPRHREHWEHSRECLADSETYHGDPHQIWYRFAGREMASTGNLHDKTAMSVEAAIDDRTRALPNTSDHMFYATGYPDGDLSFDQVNSYRQGAAGGRYTVQGGETLQSIALSTWGDASLWYKIAEANGLSGNAPLVAGQSLSLPAGVTRSANNADSFKPYDPAETLGNTSPTTPKPPKKNNCGAFGQGASGSRERRLERQRSRPPIWCTLCGISATFSAKKKHGLRTNAG